MKQPEDKKKMGSLKSNDYIKEGWEDWDPRVEDFIQHGGHGSSFSRPSNMVKATEQTKEPIGLYVRNVPLNMTNDSLQRIFSEFGSVLSVFVGKRKGDFPLTYAIIKVPSKREALKIIENLHGKPPLNLLVCFALTEEERERKRTEKQIDQNFQKQLDEKYVSDFIKRKKEETTVKNGGQFKSVSNGCGRGKILANTAKMFKGKKIHGVYLEEKEKCKENVETNKDQEKFEIHADSVDTVTELGRGTVIGPYAQPKLCVGCALEYGQFRCSICKAWYCGKACQIDDWFMHSQACKPPPPLECVEEALVASSFYHGNQKPSDSGDCRSKDFPSKPHHIAQSKFEGCMTNNKRGLDIPNSEVKQADGLQQDQLSLRKMMECDISTIPKKCRENGLKKNEENNFNSSRTEVLGVPQKCQKGNRNALDTGLSQSFRRQANVKSMSSLSESNSRKKITSDATEKTLPLDMEVLNVKCFDKAEQKKRGSCVTLVMKDRYDPVDRTLESPSAPPPSPSSPCQEKCLSQSETNTKSSQLSSSQSSCSLLKTPEPLPLRMPTSAKGNHIRPVASVSQISEGFPLTNISNHLNIDETYIGLITVVQSHRYFCALLLSPLACKVIGIDQESLEALPSAMELKVIPGLLVLAYSPTYELWYRAYVYKVEETNIHVCYIDYGNLEVVQIVKTMPEELSGEVPGLAVVARVHGDIKQSSQNWLQANIGIDKQVVMKVLAKKKTSLKVAILGDDGASVIAHFILQPWCAALPREQPGDRPSQEVQVINHAHQQKKGTRDDGSVASIHTTLREKMGCSNGRTLVNERSHSSSGANNISNVEREGKPYNVELAEFGGSPLSEVGLTLGPEITTHSLPKFWARDVPKQELNIGCQYNVLPVWVIQGNVICVQIITEKNVEFCQKIEKEISACCEKGTHPNMIQVGELVCGFFTTDNVWYRAEVTAVEENFVSVYFIDFGNSEKLPSKSIRQMDKTLVEIPALCIQATLDQVPPDSQEVFQYLKELVMKEKILIMEVLSLNPIKVSLLEDGSLVNVLSSDGDEKSGRQVELKLSLSSKSCPDPNDTAKHIDHSVTVSMKTGSSSYSLHQVPDALVQNSAYQDSFQSNQNDRTSKTPMGKETARQDVSVRPKNSVKDLEDAFTNAHGNGTKSDVTAKVEDAVQKLKGKLYKPKMLMYNECASVELPVGKDIPVIILQATDPFSIFVAPQSCIDMLENLEEMSEEMNTYCNSKHATYYRPPVGEVCIAKFSSDECWYRAACLNLGAESALVIFTDYGNIETVNCADICQMVEPFLRLPLLAQHCVLGGIKEKEYSKELSSRLSEVLPANSVHLIEVKCQQEDCTYVIEIPDIVDTLVAEGLLEKA